MKKIIFAVAIMCMIWGLAVSADVIAGYTVADYAAAVSDLASPSTAIANVSVSDMSRTDTGGKAAFSSAASGNIFWRSDFTGTTEAESIAANLFFLFTVDVDEGYALDLDSLTFDFGATQTTATKVPLPVVAYLQISTDGGSSFSTAGSTNVTVSVDDSDSGVDAALAAGYSLNVDLSSYSGLTNDVVFRVSGYFQQYNNSARYVRGGDLVLNGTVVPEPAVIGLLGVGALVALIARRRLY